MDRYPYNSTLYYLGLRVHLRILGTYFTHRVSACQREKLEPVSTHLRGFSGEKVLPLGSVQLVLTLGEPPCQATTTARFLIVDAPSAYNMLLGRPSLNAIKAIPSAYHMIIKFPTMHGVGMVRGDQRVARECYTASMKQKAVDNVSVDELDMRDEVLTRPEPSEELEPVSLDDDPEHLAYIGSKLAKDLKGLLTQLPQRPPHSIFETE